MPDIEELAGALAARLRRLPKATVNAMSAAYEKSDQVATIAYRTVVTGAKSVVKQTDAGDIQKSASKVKSAAKGVGRGIKEGAREDGGAELFGDAVNPANDDEAAALEEHRAEALERLAQSRAHVTTLATSVGQFSVAIRQLARETDWGVVTSDGGKLLEDASKLDSLLKSWQAEANKAFANVERGIDTASAGDIGVRIMQMADIQNFEAPLKNHVQLVADHVAKLTMQAAEKSAVDTSFKKEFGWAVLFGGLRVVVGAAAAIGQTQVPGLASAGAAINTGVNRLEKFAKTVRRDSAIKKRRDADGPGWAIAVLNQPDARMRVAERVCTKQKEHALSWLNFAGIAGTNVPGWSIIRLAAKTAANTYFEGRLKTLEEKLKQEAQAGQELGGIAEELGDLAKEVAIEFRLTVEEVATEKIEEIAEEIRAAGEGGEEEKVEFLEKVNEVLSELDSDDLLDVGVEFVETLGLSIGAMLIQKLGSYLLGKAQILTPAQMVTGDDFAGWIAMFAEGMAEIDDAADASTF